MKEFNPIILGDYIDTLTDYHANGSYKILKENVELKTSTDYAVMIRTLNFERPDFKNDLIYLNEKEYNYLKKTKVYPNDILMNKIANPGSVYLMPDLNKPASLAMNLFLIRFNEAVNQVFMFYLMKTNENYIKRFSNGTTTLTITKDAVRDLRFSVPSKSNQDTIAKTLSDLDSKIALNNKINTELEAMAKLIYDYWFVQFDFPSDAPENKGKPYKSSGGKMVYNEKLKREIPDGWELKPLIEEMDVQYGYPFSTKLFNEDQEGSPVVRIRNVLDNSITMYSTENADDKYLINKGDILVGMDGNFHINFWGKDGCYLNQRCVRIRKKKGSFISHFQAKFQIEPYVKAREKNVSRTTVGHLSAKDINDLNVLVPCSKKVIQGMTTFDSLLEKVIINRNENSKLVELRDWLLPMLMNGQVTVKA